ncbi:hypothetical protein [Corallococcus llansteffanensis]|nr:hypothetical protein [Corallococcus llansteffanensis]
MNDWTPKLNPSVDLRRLPLNAEEGFVLSRLDGHTRARDLPALTGLPLEKLRDILARLVEQGALLPGAEDAAPVNALRQGAPAARPPTTPAEEVPLRIQAASAHEATDADPLPETEAASGASGDGDDEPAPGDEVSEAVLGNYRKLFETRLHGLPEDQRVAMAHGVEDPELSALCFDPVPAVIKATLENPRVGLAHARLIARHHRNPVGLEALCARAAFTADSGVRRFLVRNPQLPASLFRRLWALRRLMEHHKLTVDRDVPESTRRTARELLRQRFASGPSEEKVELILNTEGRALGALVGMSVDGKTASLLCGRTYRSPLLIQNLARWSAAPPVLVAHLLKQELVRRQPQLRAMLARHPNAPADVKRA